MLSLYIHIPFCDRKCEYCNFYVIAKDSPDRQDTMIDQYLTALHAEIDARTHLTPDVQIKTIYFGWWTPGILSLTQLTNLIDHIMRVWDCSLIEELSIELNPDPFEHTLELVQWLTNHYPQFPRIRCSFGIQTFDDSILKQSWRGYIFNNVKHFLRNLREIKQATNVFNLDFIAFGTRDQRSNNRIEFMTNMIISQTFDSYSLYLLELFPGSKRHSMLHSLSLSPLLTKLVNPNEDAIMSEYAAIAGLLYQAWYTQYEVSNRSLAGKDSIHNHVYRDMQHYLWLGTSASWLCDKSYVISYNNPETDKNLWLETWDLWLVRYTNTSNIIDYIKGNYLDDTKTISLSTREYNLEKVMLALRTRQWVQSLSAYHEILVLDRSNLITSWVSDWVAQYHEDHLRLTFEGMMIANHLISDLLEF